MKIFAIVTSKKWLNNITTVRIAPGQTTPGVLEEIQTLTGLPAVAHPLFDQKVPLGTIEAFDFRSSFQMADQVLGREL